MKHDLLTKTIITACGVTLAGVSFIATTIARNHEKKGYLDAWATKSPDETRTLINEYTRARTERMSSEALYGSNRLSHGDTSLFLKSYDPATATIPERACIHWLYNARDGSFNPPVMENTESIIQYNQLDARRRNAFADFALSKENRMLTLEECAEMNLQLGRKRFFFKRQEPK